MSEVLIPAMPEVKAWKTKVYMGMKMSWVLIGHHQTCSAECGNKTVEYLVNGQQMVPLHFECAI